MRALVATGDADLVELGRVSAPPPDEMVVDVRAVSVNRGELHRLSIATAGWRPGWDFAGVVDGARVLGIAAGGSWAERVAVPAAQLAAVPDGVSWEQAAALPTAGLTALRILRVPGGLSGRSVLVTGAAGGVGRLAVQLARRAGARVTAIVGKPERGDGLGADEIAVGTERLRPEFDLILESAGGDSLREALRLVAPRGTVVSFGNSSRDMTRFSVSDVYPKEAVLRGFYLLNDLRAADDLSYLARLVAKAELTVDIAATADWTHARTILRDLRERRLAGKAVLRVTGPSIAPCST